MTTNYYIKNLYLGKYDTASKIFSDINSICNLNHWEYNPNYANHLFFTNYAINKTNKGINYCIQCDGKTKNNNLLYLNYDHYSFKYRVNLNAGDNNSTFYASTTWKYYGWDVSTESLFKNELCTYFENHKSEKQLNSANEINLLFITWNQDNIVFYGNIFYPGNDPNFDEIISI